MTTTPVLPTGLDAAGAACRLAADGPNSLPGGRRRALLTIAGETEVAPEICTPR